MLPLRSFGSLLLLLMPNFQLPSRELVKLSTAFVSSSNCNMYNSFQSQAHILNFCKTILSSGVQKH